MRSDVLKELENHLTTLNEFQTNPGVDSQRLKTLVSNLVRLRGDLMNADSVRATTARFGVRECDPPSQRHPRGHLRV